MKLNWNRFLGLSHKPFALYFGMIILSQFAHAQMKKTDFETQKKIVSTDETQIKVLPTTTESKASPSENKFQTLRFVDSSPRITRFRSFPQYQYKTDSLHTNVLKQNRSQFRARFYNDSIRIAVPLRNSWKVD